MVAVATFLTRILTSCLHGTECCWSALPCTTSGHLRAARCVSLAISDDKRSCENHRCITPQASQAYRVARAEVCAYRTLTHLCLQDSHTPGKDQLQHDLLCCWAVCIRDKHCSARNVCCFFHGTAWL